MSGHSKWHSIKHKKAAVDAKRGRLFTKLLKEITIAARMGGSDLMGNPRLRTAVQAAKDANLPKDNLERAVKKGAGELDGVSFEDFVVEGYGPGGVAIMLEGSTDNRNRTMPELRHAFGKHGGNLGTNGCVGFLFNRRGHILLSAEGLEEDAVMEAALEAGAADFSAEGDYFLVVTAPDDVQTVREALEAKRYKIDSSKVEQVPSTSVKLEGKDAEKMLKLMNALEDHEDVSSVAANFDIDPEIIEQFGE